jgi:hypothetical protein
LIRRFAALFLALGLLAGCGEEEAGKGTAELWITRDRGSEVVLTTSVPAGISAMEALRRKAEIETRHGGRFVHSINGIEGGVTKQQDWFYYVNGYWADLSAAEYRLHDGDILWWDHRSWAEQQRVPVVTGAYPEPFLHGWNGKRRPALVLYGDPRDAKAARRIARQVGGSATDGHPLRLPGTNVFTIVRGDAFFARLSGEPGGQVSFVAGHRAAARLARDPTLARFRYEGLP